MSARDGRKKSDLIPVSEGMVSPPYFPVNYLKERNFCRQIETRNDVFKSGVIRDCHRLLLRTEFPQ